MYISSAFDSGNIVVVDASQLSDIQLEIRADAGQDHRQWFHFRLTGAKGQKPRLRILNASEVSYPKGWENYRACASYDRKTWFRVDTCYDGKCLTIEHRVEQDSIHYAYFAPYSLERHADLLASTQAHPQVSLQRLGASVDGRDLDLLRLHCLGRTPPEQQRKCWVIARQHPGESMAEWLVEGLIEHLLDADNPIARSLRQRTEFFVVPNMNPDGSVRGHLRNNAAGANLNRQWRAPSIEKSPEVYWVQQAMRQHGVDFFLDVHGDEALPYNFMAGAEGIASWTPAFSQRQNNYLQALVAASPDFQTQHGYGVSRPGTANLAMATNWVGETFGCLSMTLEQPFKDTVDTPHPEGWSPNRAKQLGAAQLNALWAVLDQLKADR